VDCTALLSGYDVMPTLLALAGVGNPSAGALPGRSFLPLLLGQPQREHEYLVVYDEYGPGRMIQTKEWRYVHHCQGAPCELYHLTDDPHEQANLAADKSRAHIVEMLRSELSGWFEAYADRKMDGAYLPVTGAGQLAKVTRVPGTQAFGQNRIVKAKPE
jgi:choline-sulfatase